MTSACVVIMPCGRSLSKPLRAGLQTGNRPYAERLPAAPLKREYRKSCEFTGRAAARFTRRCDFQVFLPATQTLENFLKKSLDNFPAVVHIHTMPKELDLSAVENCVCFNLRWVTRAVTQFYDAEMRRHGIRPTQGPILESLKAKDSWNMAELR